MKKNFINEFISFPVPTKTITYQVPTYENINSITVAVSGSVFVVFNSFNFGDNLTVRTNTTWTFEGQTDQKLNAPVIFNIIVTNPFDTKNQVTLFIKRYID